MSLTTWKLEPDKYCCSMEGLLPYGEVGLLWKTEYYSSKDRLQVFMAPQTEVLYHVIAQPNSRDAVHSMLGMNRQVCSLSYLPSHSIPYITKLPHSKCSLVQWLRKHWFVWPLLPWRW